ncbi:SDR family NAD(P)-dependent oxidoreductase [Streptomyces sp. NPDC059477]|uniref:SDR family NAD(P)-dependent oxidoreductase n=1 Tax=Streptomyces sp. NPDC059477 TaxID=3346847 RepID=UPI0036D01133
MISQRCVVITGAGSGIGEACAEAFCAQGDHVVVTDIDPDKVSRVVERLRETGTACGTVLDVSDAGQVERFFSDFADTHGRLDVLVNSAASFLARGVEATPQEWDSILGVNVRGLAVMVQHAHPLLARTDGAAVVNMSSISGHVAQAGRWTYNSTKGAILSLTRCMALDLASDGIRVNSVSPGWIWTPAVAGAVDNDREGWEPTWGPYHMLRRLGEASEVASAVVFLASSGAGFITGTDLPVDGGYLAMGPEGLGPGDTSHVAGAK